MSQLGGHGKRYAGSETAQKPRRRPHNASPVFGHESRKAVISRIATVNHVERVISQEFLYLLSQSNRMNGVGDCLADFQFSLDHWHACFFYGFQPFAMFLFIKKGNKLTQHRAAIADEPDVGLPVPVNFMRVNIDPHNFGCRRNDASRLQEPVKANPGKNDYVGKRCGDH